MFAKSQDYCISVRRLEFIPQLVQRITILEMFHLLAGTLIVVLSLRHQRRTRLGHLRDLTLTLLTTLGPPEFMETEAG